MATRSFQLAKILGADGDIKADALDSAAISSGVTEYATTAVLPSTGNSFGDQALVASNNRLYIWNGSGWYNIAIVNQNPAFTTSPLASYTFDGDSPRDDITITVAASDPESLGVSFSFETGGSMDSMASVTQDSSVFTLSPKGNADLTDGVTLTGSLTIKASDGVNVVPAVSSFTLTFITIIQDTAETQILMKATGTGNNTTYDDKSTSNHTLTAYGQIEQMAFSPYRPSGYSMLFDGSNDYLSYPTSTDWQLGTGDFTLEAWVYPTTVPGGSNNYTADMTIFGFFGSPTMFFFLDHATLAPKLYNGSATPGSSIGVSTNKWSHIAFSRTSGTLKIFVNGVEGYSASYTFNHSDNSTAPYTGKNNSASNRYFHGFIADLRLVKGTGVYTTDFEPPTEKLTAITNTKLLMGGPSFRDSIPGITWNHHPTVNGPVMQAFAPYDKNGEYATTNGGSALLAPQGGNDYFTATSADFAFGTGDFTVETWIYPLNVSVHQMIFDTVTPGASGSTAGRLALYLNPNKMAVYTPGTGTITASGSQTIIVGQWHHLAWVRNSGTIKMFMDGMETHSYTSTYNYSLQTLTLGRDAASGGAGQARCILSDFRVVKGTAVYTSDFDPPTAPLTAITNTKLLLPFTDSKIFDASQGVGPKAAEVETIVTIGDGAVASTGQQHFSENTIYFDGSNDYVDISQPIVGLEDHTHEAWVYPTAGDATYKGFFASASTGSGAGISVSKDKAIGPQGGSSDLIVFNPVVPDNEWSHVVLQRQSGNHSLYRNGVLQGNSTQAVDFSNPSIRMGSRYYDNTNRMFGGYIHDFRVSKGLARYPYISKPVTLTQTNSGMTKPDGTTPTATASNTKLLAFTTSTITNDASASSHTLTAAGASAASNNAPVSEMHSVYIPNGDADIISTAGSSDHQIYGGDYTVEAWLYVTSFNSHGYWISKGGNTSREWGFGVTATGLTTYWNTTGSGGPGDSSYIPAVTNRTHEWFHVAFTKSSNTLTTFKNGNILGSGTFTSIYGGNGTLKIGRLMDYTGIAHSFNGYISNLRIIKGQAIYSANFTPPTTAFKA